LSCNSLGKFSDAEQAAEPALALGTGSWQARIELAKSFYGRRDFVVALRELTLTKIDFPDAHLVRGNVLLNLGRKNEAADELRVFLREAPGDPRREQVSGILAALGENPAVAGAVDRDRIPKF
jgi:tetratricopeptide (TPR) repeat protein